MNKQKKGFISEFKEFISKGSVMDLAVGIIIGGAFTTIVKSLVDDIIMPALSIIIGKINFSDLKILISPATETTSETAIYYGSFIQNIINFLLVAFVIFIIIKTLNHYRTKQEEAEVEEPAPTPQDIILLTEIRDLMKKD